MTDDIDVLKAVVASLQDQNTQLAELDKMSRHELEQAKAKAKEMLAAIAKEVADVKAAKAEEVAYVKAAAAKELEEVLACKSEELDDSQEVVDDQAKEIDTLKDLIYKYQVDLSLLEVMIMFAGEANDIDAHELWDRTMAHIAAKGHSNDEAVAFAKASYQAFFNVSENESEDESEHASSSASDKESE